MEPVRLSANQPPQFYRGGAQIDDLRAITRSPDEQGVFAPEDWVASTVTKYGTPAADLFGLTRLPDGRLLRDAIAADPIDLLGAAHVARLGSNPGVLVKLLDAGERLPVHCHPDRDFADAHLDCAFGKTEAWIIIGSTAPDPHVYLGFARDVGADELARWFVEQDSNEILGAMHRLELDVGDAILVPAGTPHAIGAGLFIVELQEPTDFSVMLEWKDFGMTDRRDSQLGLNREQALACFDRRGRSADDIAILHRKTRDNSGGIARLFPTAADPFFQAEEIVVIESVGLDAGYCVLIVLDGSGELVTAHSTTPLARGSTVLIPYSSGAATLRGSLRALRCSPPSDTVINPDRRL